MKTLKLVPEKTNLQFISKRKIAYVLSGLAAIASLVLFSLWDLNYGIDFQGGVVVEVRVAEEPDMEALRAAMGTLGLGDVKSPDWGKPRGSNMKAMTYPSGPKSRATIPLPRKA